MKNMTINLDVKWNPATEMYEGTPREAELPFLFTANEVEYFDLDTAAAVRDIKIVDLIIHEG